MDILSLARRNEIKFRHIMEEFREDLELTGATSVDEVDWNPETEIFFYSLVGYKATVSKTFYNVKLSVCEKLMEEFKKVNV